MKNNKDVFISYSSKDRPLVKEIVNYLEDKGLSCFWDNRNIPKGSNWMETLDKALDGCRLFLVIFTEEYNISTATDTEVGIAKELKKPILVYRIANESIPYKGGKRFCLHGLQWINAIGKPYDKFEKLYTNIRNIIPGGDDGGGPGEIGVYNDNKKTLKIGGYTLTMIKVVGGTFKMGISECYSRYAQKDEMPVHNVTLDSYYICETPITQDIWVEIMGDNPSQFRGAKLPVENVTWDKCQTFIQKLNSIVQKRFRLPTEAEWEFAARGGAYSKDCLYSGDNDNNKVSWSQENSKNQTHDVKTKAPNELGLYDISGNVSEWCLDWYAAYEKKNHKNPQGPQNGVCKVTRGGSWNVEAKCCRVSYRDYCSPINCYPDLGFRLVLEI